MITKLFHRVSLVHRFNLSVLLAVLCLHACFANAQTAPVAAEKKEPADPETRAWAEIIKAMQPVPAKDAANIKRPTAEELKALLVRQTDSVATLLADFLVKFPHGAYASDARQLQMENLQSAIELGSKEREKELGKLLDKTAKNTSLSDEDRVVARVMQLNLDLKRLGDVDRTAAMKYVVDGMILLQKDFPKSERVYTQMLGLVGSETSPVFQKLATTVADCADAPSKLKKLARDMVDGKVFSAAFAANKPMDIKFTAANGTEVDLAKLKGKVVLVVFWATWSEPSLREQLRVKDAYKRYHGKGLEVVGISIERAGTREKFMQFTRENGLTWPNYFEADLAENKFTKQFNIQTVPVMWLINKQGELADAAAGQSLVPKITYMLEAK